MSFFDQVQTATGIDPTFVGIGFFMVMVMAIWVTIELVDRR